MSFGSYIKKIRGKRTKKEIAQKAGFTAEYLRRIEDENKIPSQSILYKLANGLGIDPKELTFQALREKAPEATKEYFIPPPSPRYPKIRKILIGLYSDKEGGSSPKVVQNEIEKYEYHIIEGELIAQAYGHAEPSIKDLEANCVKKLQETIVWWNYDTTHRTLIVRLRLSDDNGEYSMATMRMTLGFRDMSIKEKLKTVRHGFIK